MVETQRGVLNLTRNFIQGNIMLNSYSTRRWVQVCLGLIFLSFIAADCPFPSSELPNVRFLYQSPSDVNMTVAPEKYLLRFRCYSGFTRIGPRAIVCLQDQWSGVVPSCAKMQCVDPPDIENAEYKLHSGVNSLPTLESSAVYTCRFGYELVNDTESTLKCVFDPKDNSAKWSGEIPVCTEMNNCPDPKVSVDGQREGDCCYSGDVLQFSCNDGFELIGPKEIECLRTGNWSSARPLCRPLQDHCPIPPPIPHGVTAGGKDGDYYLPYDETEVVCEPGYAYKGYTKYVMCEETGLWDAEFGECTEIFCDLPEPLNNGTIPELMMENLTSVPYNFEITYICDKGFRLVRGDSWRFCGKRGWSGKTPHCEEIECPDPGVPDHGTRQGESFKIGDKVFFSCFSGYYLLGSYERYCKPNGQWTGELARCDTETNYCPDPGIPINGFKNSTDYDMGARVGFRCRRGYTLLGPEAIECLPNRRWSGKETKCSGRYDYDNEAEVREFLKIAVAAKAEEQEKSLKKYQEAFHFGRILDINYPGRLILYFIFDGSGSVGEVNFHKSIEFAKAIVRKVGITPNGARAGAITFSSEAEIQFLPVDHSSTNEVMDAFDRIEFTRGGTSISAALALVRTELMPLTEAVLGKKGQKSILFVLTDGRANMGGNPTEEAELLKTAGVEIYCIGITGNVHKDSLHKIASDSDEEPHVFILENYSSFSYLIQEITNGTIDYSQCGLGVEKVGGSLRGRILGGSSANEPWPWMVAMYFLPHGTEDLSRAELQCGGSIIHERFILTAAHCMYTKESAIRKAKEIIIKLGLTHVKNESFVQEPEVQSFFIHPKYRHGQIFDYDIALLKLKTPIEFNKYVRPVCLPPTELPEDTTFYKAKELALATGWGHEGLVLRHMNVRIKSSENLKQIIMPIQSRERCIQSLKDNKIDLKSFTDRMFCAGDGLEGNDTCRGDSGGPLIQSQMNSEGYLYWSQVGIISWGIGCGIKNTYGYYSYIQRLRPWVDDTIENAINQENVI